MKVIPAFTILLLFVSIIIGTYYCDHQSENELIQEKLIGDWTSLDSCKNHNSSFGHEQLLLTFRKDDFRTKITGEPNFVIVDKRCIYLKSTDVNGQPDWHYYKIIFLGKRFLKIKPKDHVTKEYISSRINRPYKGETITLRKCRKRNAILPKKIVFYASDCYGTCPQFYIEITPDKHVKFLGESFTKRGSYVKKINSEEFNLLVKRIQQLTITNVKNEYKGCIADAQVFYMTIFYNRTHVSYKTDFCNYTSSELKFVLNHLKEIGKDTSSLKKSKTVFHYSDFDFVNFDPRPVLPLEIPFPS